MQTIHTVCYINASVRTLLYKIRRLFHSCFISHACSSLTCIVEFLNSSVISVTISIYIRSMLIKDGKTITCCQIDIFIIYIYPIGMLLATAYLISTIIVYPETVLSLTYINVIVITDTYVLSVYRIDCTCFE